MGSKYKLNYTKDVTYEMYHPPGPEHITIVKFKSGEDDKDAIKIIDKIAKDNGIWTDIGNYDKNIHVHVSWNNSAGAGNAINFVKEVEEYLFENYLTPA